MILIHEMRLRHRLHFRVRGACERRAPEIRFDDAGALFGARSQFSPDICKIGAATDCTQDIHMLEIELSRYSP